MVSDETIPTLFCSMDKLSIDFYSMSRKKIPLTDRRLPYPQPSNSAFSFAALQNTKYPEIINTAIMATPICFIPVS